MRPVNRWVIAILMAVVLLAIFVPIYYVGFGLGGMATDSCSHLSNSTFLYLEVGWPVLLLATAVVGPILIIQKLRWRWVWLSLGIGLLLSACCYVGWFFPFLTILC